MHLEDPASLAVASRRFNRFSHDSYVQTKWFDRFPKYEVIFRAIARPKMLNEALLEALLSRGAVISRHLCQMMDVLYHAVATKAKRKIDWSANLSLDMYRLLIHKATQLYGVVITKTPNFDDYVLGDYLDRAEHRTNVDVPEKILALFSQYNYMPLPLNFVYASSYEGKVSTVEYDAFAVEALLYRAPSLALFVKANGERKLDDDKSVRTHTDYPRLGYECNSEGSTWLCRKIFSSSRKPHQIKSLLQVRQCRAFKSSKVTR